MQAPKVSPHFRVPVGSGRLRSAPVGSGRLRSAPVGLRWGVLGLHFFYVG